MLCNPGKTSWMFWDWCFALALVVIVPLLYFPYAIHNLPVASHVDERVNLEVLRHFHEGSLNPHFFMYPTLYYYVAYFLTLPFSFSKILLSGRLLNLSFVGLIAATTYTFCRRHLNSRSVGVITAFCIMTSKIITDNSSYLNTDILLAVTTMASLYYLVEYFHYNRRREWFIGMVLLGCAVGCKYTAFLLYIAYYITEILLRIWSWKTKSEDEGKSTLLTSKVSQRILVTGLLSLGLIALLVALVFPVTAALEFISRNRTNADLKPPSEYLNFFHHTRALLAGIGIGCLISAIVVERVKMVYEWIAPRRLYYGLGIVMIVFMFSTPYSLITPKKFLYDVGAVARTSVIVASNHAQWSNYFSWLIHSENLILLVLSAAGIVVIGLRKQSHFLIVAVYVLVFLYVIGSVHVGFARYLTPLLPIMYCGAGTALITLWKRTSTTSVYWTRGFTIVLATIISVQLAIKIIRGREQSRSTDAFFTSYQVIKSLNPLMVLYAGYAPTVELNLAGVQTTQVSWAQLRQGPLGEQLTCKEILVFDKTHALENQVRIQGDATVSTLLDDSKGFGQQILRRSDCE